MKLITRGAQAQSLGRKSLDAPARRRTFSRILTAGACAAVLACAGWQYMPGEQARRIPGLAGTQLSQTAAASAAPLAMHHFAPDSGPRRAPLVPAVLQGVSGEMYTPASALNTGAVSNPASLASLFAGPADLPHLASQTGSTITLTSNAGLPVRFKIIARRNVCSADDPDKAAVPDVKLLDCISGAKADTWQYVIEAVTVPVAAPAVQRSL
jgi:hypothetical protein